MDQLKALEILELEINDVTYKEKIRESYKNLSRKYHPDKHSGKNEREIQEYTKKFQELNSAYEYLNNLKDEERLPISHSSVFASEYRIKEIFDKLNEQIWKDFSKVELTGNKTPEELSNYAFYAVLSHKKEKLEELVEKFPNDKFGDYLNKNENFLLDLILENDKKHFRLKGFIKPIASDGYFADGGKSFLEDSIDEICNTENYVKDIIAILLNSGLNINRQDENGQTLLHRLISNNSYRMKLIEGLLDSNSTDPNIRDNEGKTPLHLLCKNCNCFFDYCCKDRSLAVEFMKANADPDVKDNEGKKPEHYAKYGSQVGEFFGVSDYKNGFLRIIPAGLFLVLAIIIPTVLGNKLKELTHNPDFPVATSLLFALASFLLMMSAVIYFDRPAPEVVEARNRIKERQMPIPLGYKDKPSSKFYDQTIKVLSEVLNSKFEYYCG